MDPIHIFYSTRGYTKVLAVSSGSHVRYTKILAVSSGCHVNQVEKKCGIFDSVLRCTARSPEPEDTVVR